eukprot:2280771-Pleurochrysis_carterae.AAC.1
MSQLDTTGRGAAPRAKMTKFRTITLSSRASHDAPRAISQLGQHLREPTRSKHRHHKVKTTSGQAHSLGQI